MPKKSQVDGGDNMQPQSVKAERCLSAQGVGQKRKKGDACAKKIRKHVKGVVDVKKINSEEYEVSIA